MTYFGIFWDHHLRDERFEGEIHRNMTITSMKSYAIGYFEEMTVEMNGSNKSFEELQG